jgi:plastocyanin
MKRIALWAAVAAAIALPACGGSSGGGSDDGGSTGSGSGGTTVVVKDLAFKPAKLTVSAGATVTWEFKDKPTPHNVTATDKAYASDTITEGNYTHTFDQAGTYKYTCTIHPAMKGTIVVS